MLKNGLLKEPEYGNVKEYLKSASKSEVTPEIISATNGIDGNTSGALVKNILVYMHEKTKRLKDPKDNRKFRRTATEILESGERTGCGDSCTLFCALARSKGIPTIQIITFNKKDKAETGHFFAACYLKDKTGESKWYLIDPDRDVKSPEEVRIRNFNKEDRNLNDRYYAFAYVKDYSEVGIDSIQSISRIQRKVYEECDKSDFTSERSL